MKEQIKTPKKELSNKEIGNLSDAEFKTLVIRMLTEIIGYSHKIEEEVKAIQSEIKENVQGTNLWKEGNGDSNQQFGTEKNSKTFNQNRMKTQEFKKWGEA